MKILIVHNTYQQRGGEETVVAAEYELLKNAGHEVVLRSISNDSIQSTVSKIYTLSQAVHSSFGKRLMADLIDRHKPDIVHIHNFFPRLSPSVHEMASHLGVAVVQTLHNYRIICARATLLREGQICEKCISGSNVWGVIHRCYRNSFLGSAALVAMQSNAARRNTWSRDVDRFIALSDFARAKFIDAGLPSNLIVVKPNFTEVVRQSQAERSGFLFVGRLSPEKGVKVAIDAFANLPDLKLTVIGDGPLRAELETNAPSNVTFLGERSREEVTAAMRAASLLVMPSIWYEGFGMTIIEAFAAGTPVIASNVGAVADLVEHGKTGYLFKAGDPQSLVSAVRESLSATSYLSVMGQAAVDAHRIRFSPEANISKIEAIYEEAIAERAGKRGRLSAFG